MSILLILLQAAHILVRQLRQKVHIAVLVQYYTAPKGSSVPERTLVPLATALMTAGLNCGSAKRIPPYAQPTVFEFDVNAAHQVVFQD